MPRTALNTADIKVEQPAAIIGNIADRDPEIVRADHQTMKDIAADLSFMDEPMSIRLEPSADKNAPLHYPVWVNGKGAEVFFRDRWVEMTYLPVGQVVITKRKYVAVLATAKFDTITTEHGDPGVGEIIQNRVNRQTTAVTAFSVIEDKNPKGGAWLTELQRRRF